MARHPRDAHSRALVRSLPFTVAKATNSLESFGPCPGTGSRRWLAGARGRERPPLCLTLGAGDGGGSTTHKEGGRGREPERTNPRLSGELTPEDGLGGDLRDGDLPVTSQEEGGRGPGLWLHWSPNRLQSLGRSGAPLPPAPSAVLAASPEAKPLGDGRASFQKGAQSLVSAQSLVTAQRHPRVRGPQALSACGAVSPHPLPPHPSCATCRDGKMTWRTSY